MTELKETWDEIRTRLTRYVRSKVDDNVAEDIVHDILLRIFKHQDRLLAADEPMAWIYTVAKNRITDHYRYQSRLNTVSSDVSQEELIDDNDSLSSIDEDFSQCLRPLLDRLDAKYSEALLLADFDEMKQAEAAALLEISLPAMKSRIKRARDQLKNEFLDCCSVEVNRFGRVTDYQYRQNSDDNGCC